MPDSYTTHTTLASLGDLNSQMHGGINGAMESQDTLARLLPVGIFPFLLPSPDAFGDYLKSEIAKYAQVVKDSGARVD